MKTKLTKNQIVDMYKPTETNKTKKVTENNDITAKSSRDLVVIESQGKRHMLPSQAAFIKMVDEHNKIKNELKIAQNEIRILKEGMNRVIKASNTLSESLENKIDKLDS